MSRPSADVPAPAVLAAVLDRLPDGVGVLDGDGTICYVNAAGAGLLGSRPAQLLGRVLWEAVPELADTVFSAFLLHARRVGTPVTWRGFHAPAGRWLTVTAEVVGDLLHVRVAPAGGGDSAAGPAGSGSAGDDDPGALRFLTEVFEALSGTLDTTESAHRLARFVVPRLADWATVTVLGEDGAPARSARAHRSPERLADVDTYLAGRVSAPRDRSSLTAALLSGEPVQLTSIDPEFGAPSLPNRAVRDAWRRLDPTSCLFVPLQSRGEPIGVLSLVTCGSRPPHSEAEIATAVEVARRGALALDNARLYGRQLEVAETLQHSLLTPPPQPPGLEIAVRYRPASTHALVGGDWYDAFRQEDGATLLVIGDVVGHNVAAAAAMAQLRSAVRTLAYDSPGSPARTLDRVDRVLTGLAVGTLATALVARVDLPAADGTHTLRWSSAGHVPPLLVRREGTVQVLDAPPERLLGTHEPLPHTDHEACVRPGDTVVLVTDGLVEAGRMGIDEGLERLTGALAELGGLPVDALCDRLLSRIVPHRADDDIAVLAVRCTGPAD
ncbi:SpoIIE family protein phosphatase [Geodermatophilus sabuli]|uniref:SpoIIE family protein phosphatase n=1 Tax=Geodermatophilus sabuli TaxID=1564158 RepID=A0A7K3VV02_9ACTN|nr:SpoIIE family protein phosphatase [Geodermatophilus sabuli]